MRTIEIKKSSLTKFIKSMKQHQEAIDQLMEMESTHVRGKLMAKEVNRFNFDLDMFIHNECGVPIEKIKSVLNKSFKL